jgi:hypothetical protein
MDLFPFSLICKWKLRNAKGKARWAWWFTPAIPALGRLKQKDHKFQANLSCIMNK